MKKEKKRINSAIEVHFISFDRYDDSFKKLLDEHLCFICEGIDNPDKLDKVKKKLRRYLKGKVKDKSDPSKIAGWLSELFCHIYLNELGYKPAFLFQNLEEQNSMKKGFDGFYVKNKSYFIYESKSTMPKTKSKNHLSSVRESFNDIKNKIGGKKLTKEGDPIDPWSNAIFHANNTSIAGKKTLISFIDDISDNFFEEVYENITNHNVIPSSTIYYDSDYKDIDTTSLKKIFESNKGFFSAKKNIIICVNKYSYDYINTYLNE